MDRPKELSGAPQNTLGERIRARRMALGMTQQQLGNALGHAQSYVAALELSGEKRKLRPASLAKLAEALRCSMADLLPPEQIRVNARTDGPPSFDRKEIGVRLQRRREALGWKPEELAARTGIHRNEVNSFERGARNPNFEFLAKAAQAMGCDLEALVPDLVDDPQGSPPVVLIPSVAPSIWVGRKAEDRVGLESLGFLVGVRTSQMNELVANAAAAKTGLAIRGDLPEAPVVPSDDRSDGLGIEYRRGIYEWVARTVEDVVDEQTREIFLRVTVGGEDRTKVAREWGMGWDAVRVRYREGRNVYKMLIEGPKGRAEAARLIRKLARRVPVPVEQVEQVAVGSNGEDQP